MYTLFTETQKNAAPLPLLSNLVNFSIFQKLECKLNFRSFMVKYVCEGTENYKINGLPYHINEGQYLLLNQYAEGTGWLDSPIPVKGICIDISPAILSEVVGSFQRPDTPIADPGMDQYFNTSSFVEKKIARGPENTALFLNQLKQVLLPDPHQNHQFSAEFFYDLAECIVLDHQEFFKQFNGLSSLKSITRKDLFHRVSKGKVYIENHFRLPLDIKSIARESSISEYHFYRLFKAVYGIAPYQYIMKLRLEHAWNALRQGHTSITLVAFEAGFADIFSFSKAFKKRYGHSPSKYFNAGSDNETN
jgi:AraC family transcriptional regulator